MLDNSIPGLNLCTIVQDMITTIGTIKDDLHTSCESGLGGGHEKFESSTYSLPYPNPSLP